jgi:hypothetical protein
MNDLGTLATQIVNFGFQEDTGRFPVTYVSGWLDANIGILNQILHEEFAIDSTGAFSPILTEEVESIFSEIYSTHYYQKASRDALRGFLNSSATAGGDWISLKEGDTYIQRPNPNAVSRSFDEFAKEAQTRLDNLVFNYNRGKCGPIQVTGET